MKKKQTIKTPPILPCARCGAEAMCIDWDFNDMWRVMCDNNHTSTKRCGTAHRAICRWNNAQTKLKDTSQTVPPEPNPPPKVL